MRDRSGRCPTAWKARPKNATMDLTHLAETSAYHVMPSDSQTSTVLDLAGFFASRKMQQTIIDDALLHPDHHSFDPALAGKLIARYESIPAYRQFCISYKIFMKAFGELYKRLDALNLKQMQPLEFALVAISYVMAQYGHMASKQGLYALVTAEDGNQFTVSGMIEGIFDTLKVIIDYAAYLKRDKNALNTEPVDVVECFRLFNLFRMIKRDWQDCLWLDNLVNVESSVMLSNPIQVGRRIGLARDSYRRIAVTGAGIDKLAKESWFQSENIKMSGKMPRNFAKYFKQTLAIMPYPYLEEMLNVRSKAGYTLRQLFKVYVLLKFIGARNFSLPDFGNFAFTRQSMVEFVSAMLGESADVAQVILDELTYQDNQKDDIWYTPLLRDEAHFVLLVPMIATANVERFLEHALASHAADTKEIGKIFETYVCTRLNEFFAGSKLKGIAKAVGARKLAAQGQPLEIDLFILINRTIFVCEVKHTGFAADELSVYHYFDVLKGGCEQALEKTELLQQEWPRFSAQLDLPASIKAFLPLCITGKYFGSGCSFAGVPIISIQDLEDFIVGEVHFDVGFEHGALKQIGKTVATFTSADTADAELWNCMRNNPRMIHYVPRLAARPYRRDYQKSYGTTFSYEQFELWLRQNPALNPGAQSPDDKAQK
jgi:hypothetical protein